MTGVDKFRPRLVAKAGHMVDVLRRYGNAAYTEAYNGCPRDGIHTPARKSGITMCQQLQPSHEPCTKELGSQTVHCACVVTRALVWHAAIDFSRGVIAPTS